MRNKSFIVLACLLILLLISGCRFNPVQTGEKSLGPIQIACEVYYRPDGGRPLEAAPEIILNQDNLLGSVVFETLSFKARFQNDPYQGQALSIHLTTPENDEPIISQLYQFDSNNTPVNQFIGGHGFTGLVYAFHPELPSEMQYFCNLR